MSQSPNFTRDKSSTALINTDKDGLLAYQKARRKSKLEQDRYTDLESRVANLEKQIAALLATV